MATGGHEYELVQPSPDSLECSVCLQVLRDPHITSCCGHHFCHSCIARIQSNNKPCPLCNEGEFTTLLNKAVAREVNALLVYCPLKSRGCDWQGELGKVEQHLNGCGFKMADCKYQCGERLEQRMIAKHEFEDCPRRPIEVQMAFLMQRMDTQATEIKSLKGEMKSLKTENSSLKDQVSALQEKTAVIPSPSTPPFYYTLAGYNHYKDNNLIVRSRSFYTHPGGYKMELQIFTNGISTFKGTQLAVYIGILRGEFDGDLEWPFKGKVTVQMLNPHLMKWGHTTVIDYRVAPKERVADNNIAKSHGSYKFISIDELKHSYLAKHDSIRFKVPSVEL